MQKFQARLQPSEGFSYLKLGGVIDEDNHLRKLTGQLKGSAVVLDLSEVERINSCGVRDWVNWLSDVEASGFKVVMVRCSSAIINQVNMVTNFIGDAFVHSFFAPYLNPETEQEKNILLFTETLAQQNPVLAPTIRCEDTGYLLEFDDFEESYFAFIPDMADRPLPSELSRFVEQAVPELGHLSQDSEAASLAEPEPRTSPNNPIIDPRTEPGLDPVAESAFAPRSPALDPPSEDMGAVSDAFITSPQQARERLAHASEGAREAPTETVTEASGTSTGLMIGLGAAVVVIVVILVLVVL